MNDENTSSIGDKLTGLIVRLTPEGELRVTLGDDDTQQVPCSIPRDAALRIVTEFQAGHAAGILHLTGSQLTEELPSSAVFWRELGRLFFARLCAIPDLELTRKTIDLPQPTAELARLSQSAPPMQGGEYLSAELLSLYWRDLLAAVQKRIATYDGSVEEFLRTINPAWNFVGRVCFHLAENKQSQSQPFAFLATYTNRLSANAKAQHLPLGRAIQEFSGAGNKNALLTLLRPVQKAAESSKLLRSMVDAGEIFHPQAWTPTEAFRFLKDIPAFEAAGVVVRVPDWWQSKRPPRPEVKITIGDKGPSGIGFDSLVDFNVALTLEGESLTEAEWQEVLSSASGLVSIKGKWVEIDQEKLSEVLQHWQSVQNAVASEGVSFADAMRLMAGASGLASMKEVGSDTSVDVEWCRVVAGDWLHRTLTELRNPSERVAFEQDPALKANLRPYQQAGVQWLWLLHNLRLGACLADDMGLGKTIQILALLLLIKKKNNRCQSLLVVPASLIGNWLSEAEKFAPSLTIFVLHPSMFHGNESDQELRIRMEGADLTITTYGLLSKFQWLSAVQWQLVVLDEAQAIKNPGTKQSAATKALKAHHRIALTGTPVENRLSDLWSLFDFICPGLLGSPKAFAKFVKEKDDSYRAIRELIRPYILRRLKTDRSIISDLPDKTEVQAYCPLSKIQAGLYAESVDELTKKINEVEGIKRRGVILAFLMRFKQICNHPSQWLGDSSFDPLESGKFVRLGELCEEIALRQEKVLVFTQFREMTAPLSSYLEKIFGKEGLVLHGETSVKHRKALVDDFQRADGPPFFVLSLKAGGTGLNLTAASHVIHFDRWWNPAVENQATDRAYRIGQKRNVLVHKFICRGTLEEKVDAMIEDKKSMASEILEGGSEAVLTELSNEDLIKLVSLDLKSSISLNEGK